MLPEWMSARNESFEKKNGTEWISCWKFPLRLSSEALNTQN
jgi:hypothetical protein